MNETITTNKNNNLQNDIDELIKLCSPSSYKSNSDKIKKYINKYILDFFKDDNVNENNIENNNLYILMKEVFNLDNNMDYNKLTYLFELFMEIYVSQFNNERKEKFILLSKKLLSDIHPPLDLFLKYIQGNKFLNIDRIELINKIISNSNISVDMDSMVVFITQIARNESESFIDMINRYNNDTSRETMLGLPMQDFVKLLFIMYISKGHPAIASAANDNSFFDMLSIFTSFFQE